MDHKNITNFNKYPIERYPKFYGVSHLTNFYLKIKKKNAHLFWFQLSRTIGKKEKKT